ncbi:MAG: translation initiation factor IF-3 [Deltaproteobacteria bacterium]|nr:translation initiation factor IF-3 [Deltaproteobacteria bacterium]
MPDLRVNRRVRVPEIRLIGPDGAQLGVFQTLDAMRKAEEFGLDLVEISPTARPPVCKIMDYGKYKYEQAKRMHEARKHQVVVHTKEVKMRPVTDQHDFATKVKHIRRFLTDGNKAKVTIQFRGREMMHRELGQEMLRKVVTEMGPLAAVEQMPKFEGRFLSLILAPAKR